MLDGQVGCFRQSAGLLTLLWGLSATLQVGFNSVKKVSGAESAHAPSYVTVRMQQIEAHGVEGLLQRGNKH